MGTKKVMVMNSEVLKTEKGLPLPVGEVLSQKMADYARKGLEGAANTQRAYQSDLKYLDVYKRQLSCEWMLSLGH